jgi:hypothetical protein
MSFVALLKTSKFVTRDPIRRQALLSSYWDETERESAELNKKIVRLEAALAENRKRSAVARLRHQSLRSQSAPGVPSLPETIISYVCTPDRLVAVMGDLQRNFSRRAAKHGEKAARRWYWWQTARTVAAFVFQIIVKVVMLRELLRKLGL